MFCDLNANMKIEKPGNFTRHKDKYVIDQKGYGSHKIRRVWAKLEYNISCKAINRKLENLCVITINIKYKKSLRQQNISYFGSPKRANREGQEGKKREEEEEEGEAKKKGMDFYDFWCGIVWNLTFSMEL